MNKLLQIAVLAALISGCRKDEPATALPPASETATASADAAEAHANADASPGGDESSASMPVSGTGLAPVTSDDRLVNASIDKVLGDHDKYQAAIEAYQAAVRSDDRNAVAALVRYPLEVSVDGTKTSIRDAASFVQQYDRIITPAIARVITAQKYSDLMVSQQGVMFGSGETWLNGICKPDSADCSEFEVRIIAIQAGGATAETPGADRPD